MNSTTLLEKYFTTVISIIEDRLYFTFLTNSSNGFVKSDDSFHYFTTDKKFVYNSFNDDFGPLNLSCVYRFNHTLMRKLKMKSLSKRKLVYYTWINDSEGEQKKVNSAFLMGTFMIMHLSLFTKDVYPILESGRSFIPFRDASFKLYDYHITLMDCLSGFEKGVQHGFFDTKSFDVLEYEHFEKVDNGDFNWIIPGRILAFCSPQSGMLKEKGAVAHTPTWYADYFKRHEVSAVVRLNETLYDSNDFTRVGIDHHELFFPDGSTPSQSIVNKFIKICEGVDQKDSAVAVHCKAGLGRTGTLIACFMMKRYKMSARESIAWIRIARPGSIIGQQQDFLDKMEKKFSTEALKPSEPKITPPTSTSHDERREISEIETAVGDMNLSKAGEKRGQRGKQVLVTLANSPQSQPVHSHFLRSRGKMTEIGDASLEINIENIPQIDVESHDGDEHQGEKLNIIKVRRMSARDQTTRSTAKNRSQTRSAHRVGNLRRPSKNDGNFKKKKKCPSRVQSSNVQCVGGCRSNSDESNARKSTPKLTTPRLTRSSFRI